MRVEIAWLPPASPPLDVTCVVVDVLRATSSIAVLLGRGLRGVYPAADIDEARRLRHQIAAGRDDVMLCGERNAQPPEGFDFGNSPTEFASADLDDWSLAVMATTNGTPALLACAGAPLVLAAAPLNAGATVEACVEAGRDVLVVGAGRRGERAADDGLAAGLIAQRLVEAGAIPEASAREGISLLEAVGGKLASAFRMTTHGRSLIDLGFAADIDFCAAESRYETAAVLRLERANHVLRPLLRDDPSRAEQR